MRLRASPFAALVMLWRRSHRQVRIEGWVEEVPATTVAEWWLARPRQSRVAAIASSQSAEIASRDVLQRAYAEADAALPDEPPQPWHFVGQRIVPDRVEFWQEGPGRLHDRLAYVLGPDGGWRSAPATSSAEPRTTRLVVTVADIFTAEA